MANLTVRNIPDEVHRALKMQAAAHGHSTEAEIRHILAQAVAPKESMTGAALVEIFQQKGLTDAEVDGINRLRKMGEPAEPIAFE